LGKEDFTLEAQGGAEGAKDIFLCGLLLFFAPLREIVVINRQLLS